MIKKIFLFLVLILVLVGAYHVYRTNPEVANFFDKTEPKTIEVNVNETFILGRKDTAVLKDDPALEIKIKKIEDSRCPIKEVCVWEGELIYSITINGEERSISTVRDKDEKYDKYTLNIVEEECTNKALALNIQKDEEV